MSGLLRHDCECDTGCVMGISCICCPWCCKKCKNNGNCKGCKPHYLKRTTYADPSYKCETFDCNTKCRGKESTCQCECCKKKCSSEQVTNCSAAQSPGHYTSSRADPHTASQQQLTDDSTSSPAILPIIIAAVPVALIIVVICVMVYFRIRPFHRVRYLLRS
ncbi:hypothetical protein BBBOND_0403980 [Babesia bigemina]|uniref:Uncharacterized protein n=1 Tax=Babesia bigemina TaxID=5866 RepID=A0A061DEU9_BABBI|nr:hypothetical protein BBBOND_0403980 [Babesia bigemina]CDR97910.1 hypothetical protein BBBOND_0403980 [Babesia bigemina]|eukprot:XP_012770096.1 hypothetical protein BBBOND_0403980 [Babesia bigemina]